MSRALGIGLALILFGCSTVPERAPLKPLTEDSPPLTYAELLSRARSQATAATEAFYVNAWTDLEEVARGLEQTSRFMSKAIEVPARHRDRLKEETASLETEARQLQDAAKARDEKKTNEIMQRINLLVRELRAEN
jgi:hypothetical protein